MKIKPVVLSLFLVISGLSSKALPDEFTVNIPTPYVSVIENAQGYAEFSGTDIQYLTQSGEPMIPYYVERVQLPSNADLTTVSVSIEAYGLEPVEGEWDVLPIPPIAYWNGTEMVREWPEGKTIVNERDVDIYENSILFPANILHTVSTGQKRRQKLVEVPVALYQYNPGTNKLYHLVEVRLGIKFSVRLEAFSDQFDIFDSGTSNESDKTYLILTTNTIKERSTELANFVDHKEKSGFSVEVVTEDTWGGGIGDTAAENIRNWLQVNYINLNIEYVLLIGNPHPSLGDVPMKMLWSKTNDLAYNIEFPSDYYYTDLTGNWDLDNDGFYGEWEDDFGSGGVDRYWEVIVGRIPFYGNLDDLDSILKKIIYYENTSLADASWRKNMLFINKPLTERTPGYRVGEAIKEDIILPKENWGYYRVYDQDYGLTPPPETSPTTFENVANVWNGSNFGAVFWYGHGGPLIAYDIMDLSHAATLGDSHPAFIFQASCSTSYPESENLSYYLLVNGCLSTIGATRVSYNLGLQTNFSGTTSNQGLLYEYAKRLIGDGMNCGQSLQDIKEKLIPSRSAFWANFLVYNIYGDPSTGLSTYVPPCYYDGGDSDLDGICSNFDNCPGIENPAQTDSDSDGVGNECDGCPYDTNKIEPGICGCGVPDIDTDLDTILDCNDTDDDDDGVLDEDDSFPLDDTETVDTDNDGTGDNADTDDDNDGISDLTENGGPNSGDANNDGTQDSLQRNVASLVTYIDQGYVVLESPLGTVLSSCQAAGNPSPDDAPAKMNFNYGFFDFTISGLTPGGSTTLTITLSNGAKPDTYYKYGKTQINQVDHWYEFLYDNETGAEINGNVITLHFMDALRGDDELAQDSQVIDLGGPGFAVTDDDSKDGGGGGDGCFVDSLRY
jgi:hypothetical protein